MRSWAVTAEVSVDIDLVNEAAITRITGEEGEDWRSMFYPLHTEQDVLEHWAYNAVVNGVTRANRLEGWADLAHDAATFRVIAEVDVIAAEEI